MPKSRGKGRYQPRKKKMVPPAPVAGTAAQPIESRQPTRATATMKSSPAARTVAAKAAAPVLQYPYITSDLIRIAVFTGVIVVIMIILALIIS